MPPTITTSPELSGPGKIQEAKTPSKSAATSISQQNQDCQHSKAKQALPHIAVLFKGFLFFALLFAVFGVGFRILSLEVKLGLEHAEDTFRGYSNVQYREQLLYTWLDELTSTQLTADPRENYNDCLVRGMNHVNQQLIHVGLHYPDIRNRTIDWTVENCGRLHHTLQPVQPSIQELHLTYWKRVLYRGRRLSEKAGEAVLAILRPLKSLESLKSLGSLWPPYQAQTRQTLQPLTLHIPSNLGANPEFVVLVNPRPGDLKMPTGFALACEEESSCGIVFTESSTKSEPHNKTTIPAEIITKAARRVRALHKLYTKLNCLKKSGFFSFRLFLYIALYFVFGYVAVAIYSGPFKSTCANIKTHLQRQIMVRAFTESMNFPGRLAALVGFVLLNCHFLLPRGEPSERDMRIARDVWLLSLLLLTFAIKPVALWSESASIEAMFKAFMALNRIDNSSDAPPVEASVLTAQEKDLEDHLEALDAMARHYQHMQSENGQELQASSLVGVQEHDLNSLPAHDGPIILNQFSDFDYAADHYEYGYDDHSDVDTADLTDGASVYEVGRIDSDDDSGFSTVYESGIDADDDSDSSLDDKSDVGTDDDSESEVTGAEMLTPVEEDSEWEEVDA